MWETARVPMFRPDARRVRTVVSGGLSGAEDR